jgi:uncharacterized protein YdaL
LDTASLNILSESEGAKVKRYPVIRLCLVLTLSFFLSFAAGKDEPKKAPVAKIIPKADVLILHDSLPGPLSPGLLDGNTILDLLGHFGLKGALAAIEDYKPGDTERYRFVIMLGVDIRKAVYPQSLIMNIRSAQVPVFWIGNHLPDLTSDPMFVSKIGFRISGPGITQGFKTVNYKGVSLTKNDPSISPVEILDPAKAQILATAQNTDGKTLPYIVRSGNFWYCADSPFGFAEEGDRYLAFCDLLHDFLKVQHQEERNALVRLEDISIEEDPKELEAFADYLHERNIPFQISLIPIYVNPKDNTEIRLTDRPAFVRAIRYMVSKGGLVVLHGVTHQYRGKSGDDYEFWDEFADRPVPKDSRALIEEKLRLGLEECFRNGIYPVTWETPHYAGSQLDYRTVGEYFNSSYERILSADRGESGHFFPYTTVDRFGRFIIPENLGYIPEESPDPAVLVKNAERLKAVRDGVASFFFHPFLDIKYLESCIDGIEKLGYHFISIGDYDLRVQMDSRLIQTFTEPIQAPMKNLYLHRFLIDNDGRRSGESYSQKLINGVFKDPGIVPPNTLLVMEGVPEIVVQSEPETPGAWTRFQSWISEKIQRLTKTPDPHNLLQPQVRVLYDDTLARGDNNDQQSFLNAFSAFNFRVSKINWKNYAKNSTSMDEILVIPRAVAIKLSEKQTQWVEEFVRGGGCIVLDGPSPLSELLGIRSEKRSLEVNQVIYDENWISDKIKSKKPKNILTWNPPASVTRFSNRNTISVFAVDKESELPLAVLVQCGQGRLLYLGARLDPITALGYTRYPYFIHYVLRGFNLKSPLQRNQVEFYFEPGNRSGIDIEHLAAVWRARGVRAIYAAAFHFYDSWSYDYAHLIDVCHRNGILVYAWFELPHVSSKFWNDHANWRAKTANGKDGQVGWRFHMDLDIPECQDAAFDFAVDLLKRLPWDGVNIAELNYDTLKGPEDPDSYLPMGKTTRDAFKALGGFDPIQLFKEDSPYYWKQNHAALKRFEDYRVQRVLAWHRAFLERVAPIAKAKDMEIILTIMDSLHSTTATRDTGVDSRLLIPLMDLYPITLQVQDPAHHWAENPDRYRTFTKTYLKLVRDRKRLMFDINVIPDRNIKNSHSPTQLQVGVELARSLFDASEASGRVGIYSEYTVPQEDMQTLSTVLAHDATLDSHWNSWDVQSKTSVSLTTPGDWKDYKVDNIFWPGWGANEILLPAGIHQIKSIRKGFRLFNTSLFDIGLVRFTGDLKSISRTDRGFQFSYDDSIMRNLASFNKQPFEILLDGRPYSEPVSAHAGLWSIRLPRGRHTVDILADSTAIIIMEKTSFYGSFAIVAFGVVSCGLMLLIYFSILARRALGRAVSGKASTASTRPSKS